MAIVAGALLATERKPTTSCRCPAAGPSWQGFLTGTGAGRDIPTKDQEICGAPRMSRRYCRPDQGVQDAVVYLRRVAKGKPGASGKGPGPGQQACRFEPPSR